MGVSAADVKWLFCTWKGIEKLKRVTNLVCGVGVILCAVLSILNIIASVFDLIGFIRQLWNGLFGALMIMLQLNWTEWITRRFGLLPGWFGRGMFFLFVGSNVMVHDSRGNIEFFSIFTGGCCLFVGGVELLFGFKCGSASEAADAEAGAQPAAEGAKTNKIRLGYGGKPKAEGGSGAPAFTVNVTPNQLAQGATFAANNAGTVAAAANAAGGAGGGGAANPFFGNAHLN